MTRQPTQPLQTSRGSQVSKMAQKPTQPLQTSRFSLQVSKMARQPTQPLQTRPLGDLRMATSTSYASVQMPMLPGFRRNSNTLSAGRRRLCPISISSRAQAEAARNRTCPLVSAGAAKRRSQQQPPCRC